MGIVGKFVNTVKEDWHHESQRLLFNVLLTFLGTFTVAHLYSLFVPFYIFIRGYHIHHFYYGIILVTISAVVSLVTVRDNIRRKLSYAVGIGIGLIGGNAMQAISRQPEALGDIRANMLLMAAFVEAVALFACVIAIIK